MFRVSAAIRLKPHRELLKHVQQELTPHPETFQYQFRYSQVYRVQVLTS